MEPLKQPGFDNDSLVSIALSTESVLVLAGKERFAVGRDPE